MGETWVASREASMAAYSAARSAGCWAALMAVMWADQTEASTAACWAARSAAY